MKKTTKPPAQGQHLPARTEFLLYKTEDGRVRIQTRLENETVWLSINQMADLFGVDKSGVSRHLKNIYETGELAREATVAKFATVQQEGDREVARQIEHYNLDAIISVGYCVNSIRGIGGTAEDQKGQERHKGPKSYVPVVLSVASRGGAA